MSVDNEQVNKISNDQYGLLEAFTNFTENYFGTSPDNTKLGLFGYINEAIAHVGKVGMFHRNRLYNEFCLNSASLPSTIYGIAADEDVEIQNATPSKATVVIDIPSVDLRNAIDASNDGYVRLNRETFVVKMDGTEFRLPFSVIIRKKENSLSAFYQSINFSDGENRNIKAEVQLLDVFKDYKTSIYVPIKEYVEKVENKQYTSLRIDVYQYKINKQEETYFISSLNSNAMFQVDYSDYLAAFDVYYKDTKEGEFELLEKYTNADLVTTLGKFCIYKYIDDDTFQIYFNSSSSIFRPANNSTVLIQYLTTSGANGNFVFSGTININDEATENPLPFDMTGWIYNQPSGGKDRPSLLEIKRTIFDQRQKVMHKSSAEDLNKYFSQISSTNFNDGSRVKFFKERDDVIAREFNGFLMITDEQKRPYPMNTIDITLDSSVTHITPAMPIIYDETTKTYKVINDDVPVEDIKKYMFDSNKFIYFSPFSFYVNAVNIGAMFFDENINETYPLTYKLITNDSTDTPLLNYLSAYRNPAIGSSLQLSLPVTISDGKAYKFLLCIRDISSVFHIVEMIYDEEEEKCFCEFNVSNISKRSATCKPISDYPVYNSTWSLDTEFSLSATTEFIVYTLEEIDTENGINDNKSNSDFEEVFGKYTSQTNLPYDNYRVKALSVSPSEFITYTPLNDVLSSKVADATDEDGDAIDGKYMVYRVPVAGGLIIFSNSYYDYFIKQLKSYISEMKDTLNYITNSTSMATKFYNTYGPCVQWQYIFYNEDGSSSNIQDISRTNLSFVLAVERENGRDEEIDAQIKEIVKQFVIDLNTQIEESVVISGKISLSNLTTKIEDEIVSIASCNIISVNDVPNVRYIELKPSADEETERFANTPEYLSLDIKRMPSDIMNIDEMNITINYV